MLIRREEIAFVPQNGSAFPSLIYHRTTTSNQEDKSPPSALLKFRVISRYSVCEHPVSRGKTVKLSFLRLITQLAKLRALKTTSKPAFKSCHGFRFFFFFPNLPTNKPVLWSYISDYLFQEEYCCLANSCFRKQAFSVLIFLPFFSLFVLLKSKDQV